MEKNSSLTSSFLLESRLRQVRYARVLVERLTIGKKTEKPGVLLLNVNTSFGPNKTDPMRAAVKVILDARGVPQDTSPDSEDLFKILVEVRGVYVWPRAITNDEVKDTVAHQMLYQPLFLLASQKVTELLLNIGIKGVEIDLDFRTLGDEAPDRDALLGLISKNAARGDTPKKPVGKKAPAKKLAAAKKTRKP